MVNGDDGRDAALDQLVDEAVIEGNAFLIDSILHHSSRDDARPCYGEAIVLQSDGFHHCDILLVLVVVVVGHISSGP